MKVVVLWSAALAAAASLLIVTDYRSRDPDSALYARLSSELAKRPVSQWIAPEWGGAWDQEGAFREHPAGILLLPALLIRAGVPAEQASYIVNMLYQAAVIVLIPAVAGALVQGFEARALAWVLQLLPVSFVYRIRANQEHPVLMGFLAILYGIHHARTNPRWLLLVVPAFSFVVLVKGAFAMFALAAAGLWVLLVPAPPGGSNRRAWIGLALAAVVAGLVVVGYEALYVRATGQSFLAFYGSTRLGQSIRLSGPEVIAHSLGNVVWYLSRLTWFAAPWSLFAYAALLALLTRRKTGELASSNQTRDLDERARRGMIWAFLMTAMYVAVLSPALVRAERFIFPAYFAIGAIGVVTAIRSVDVIRRAISRADAYAWLPVAVWFGTFALSLASRIVRM